jgi:radical SAM protein with 4Fe4S-binding SPASM domain
MENETDKQKKETKPDNSLHPNPAAHLPVQIYRLHQHKEELRRRQLKPSCVQWLCSNQCQFNCGHCGLSTPETPFDELTTKEVIEALDALSFLGCEIFSVIGGNPFIRKDLFDILGYAKGKGMKIALTTHSSNIENFLNEIERAEPDSIMISIDGYKDHHDKVRGEAGAYEKSLQSIKSYYDMDIPAIGVSMTVMDDNVHDIPKIIEDVYTYGGNRIRIQPSLSNNKQKKQNHPLVAKEALRQVHDARLMGIDIEASEGFGYLGFRETLFRSSSFFCGCGWDTMSIMMNGDVMGCLAVNSPNHIEGNIKKDDLREIWFSKFDRFRCDIPRDVPLKCRSCKYLQICRGGCWLFRVYGQDPCFLNQAEELLADN